MLKPLDSHIDYSKLLLWLASLVFVSGCTTGAKGVQSEKLMRSLRSVKKAVYYAMKNNVKNKSRNERTFYSAYHKPGLDLKMSAYLKAHRAQLVITILGDRRPYKVEVEYRVEKRDGSQYNFDHYDDGIAEHYLERVKDYLASRPEERDVIDDFRVY